MGGGGGGVRGGRLLTFSAFRMGAYSRWALIRINTVIGGTLPFAWSSRFYQPRLSLDPT